MKNESWTRTVGVRIIGTLLVAHALGGCAEARLAVVFLRDNPELNSNDVLAVFLDETEPVVLREYANARMAYPMDHGPPVPCPGSRRLVTDFPNGSTLTLWSIDARGRDREIAGRVWPSHLACSADGQTVAWVETKSIHTVPIRGGDETVLTEGTCTHLAVSPVDAIAVTSCERDGSMELTLVELEDGSTSRLSDGGSPQRFSPDGALLAVLRSEDLYVVDMVSGEDRLLVPATEINLDDPVFHPDGDRLFALAGTIEDSALYAVDLDSGTVEELVAEGVTAVDVSPDGARLVAAIGGELVMMDLVSGEQEVLFAEGGRTAASPRFLEF